VGHAGVPELAQSMKLEWSDEALADLDRFAEFLDREHPSLAAIVATEIIDKVRVLSEHPQLGRPIAGREEYRQIVLQVLGAAYVFQYRFDGQSLVMLRVYHACESRG
jgi:toxin ParE1/3/4